MGHRHSKLLLKQFFRTCHCGLRKYQHNVGIYAEVPICGICHTSEEDQRKKIFECILKKHDNDGRQYLGSHHNDRIL